MVFVTLIVGLFIAYNAITMNISKESVIKTDKSKEILKEIKASKDTKCISDKNRQSKEKKEYASDNILLKYLGAFLIGAIVAEPRFIKIGIF